MADLIRRSDVIGLLEDMLLFGEYDIIASAFSKADEEKAYQAIREIPAVNRWIPCSERLPHGGRVLATTKQGYVVDVIFVAKGSQWFRNGECCSTDTVIAWMPMPDAYEPTKE